MEGGPKVGLRGLKKEGRGVGGGEIKEMEVSRRVGSGSRFEGGRLTCYLLVLTFLHSGCQNR